MSDALNKTPKNVHIRIRWQAGKGYGVFMRKKKMQGQHWKRVAIYRTKRVAYERLWVLLSAYYEWDETIFDVLKERLR